MPRRLHATLADYVIVAINPALIMLLIGSLVYFLLEMFYQGQYPARLHYCLSWYIFGAVLVSRVSMEEGWDHAAPLGVALAIVMVLALHRFVSYAGTSFAAIGWLINYALIALISWCAHRLTWDCTLIDDSQDASGEGLLQTAGIDSQDKQAESAPSSGTTIEKKNKAPTKTADDTLPSIAVEIDKSNAAVRAVGKNSKKSWWQEFVERRRRPHAPGVWIVYFSLAALPLFGFGQALIPVANTSSRRYAFVLLSIYVACGLALLLTTSFLGLRRYLRQRKLEMPAAMTGTWLTTGAVLIVGLILFSALLPRPNAEYAISQLPGATSKQRETSRFAVGKEGTKDEQAKTASGKSSHPDDKQQPDSEAKSNGTERSKNDSSNKGTGKSDNNNGSGKQQPSDNSLQNQSSQDGKSESDQSSDASSNNQKSPGNEAKGDDSKPDASSNDASPDKQPDASNNSDAAKNTEPKQDSPSQNQNQNDQQKSDSQDPSPPDSSSQPEPSNPNVQPPDITALSEPLLTILKWIFYGAVITAAVWWLWRHRARVPMWLRALLNAWREFWANLFGRRRELPESIQIAPIHRSFSEYSDPFAAGIASRYPPEELIRYSFEAFEAWARDQGWPRDNDQTAYEFARSVGSQSPHMAAPARALADLYSRVAYAPGTLPVNSVEFLRPLWQSMRAPQLAAG